MTTAARTITNKAGLPEALVRAIANDPYEAGDSDSTITRLIQPPRKVELERLNADKITEDAADRIWALMGQLGHTVLERAGVGMVETRLFAEVAGWRISGKADIIVSERKIVDWKFTTVWSTEDGAKDEWVEQLNGLAFLASRNGLLIESLEIVCIYRDWSKLEARRNADYPKSQVQVFKLPMWPAGEQEAWITSRVWAHQIARVTLPECSSQDRWEKPHKWALMKKGRERAVKLFDNPKDAKAARTYQRLGFYVEHRPGEQVRCQSYCAARPFCTQADALGVPKDSQEAPKTVPEASRMPQDAPEALSRPSGEPQTA